MGRVTVIGGGLAGCEAAFRLARGGVEVDLLEMKPVRRGPVQRSDDLAELVCSNSLRSDDPHNAVGLLHEELRRAGSLVLSCADQTRVPAGDALAVDRERFSRLVTERLESEPLVRLRREEATRLPEPPGLAVVATGPLTSDPLAAEVARACGGHLAFYDAIAPVVAADTIDMSVAFAASRWGKGGGDDYLNLPMDQAEYRSFVEALLSAEKVQAHDFEDPRWFEGCLPVEVMAARGPEVLAHGPMKPVGLRDPRTGRRPHAVVQLRREDAAGTAWNLVGFQTRLTWPEQRRVFRGFIPGLAGAEFQRLGQVHRNTFVDAPRVLASDLSLRDRPHLFLAGQITGVEGYVESAACGHLAARAVLDRLAGRAFRPPPGATALGALYRHVTGAAHPAGHDYQPSNVVFALFPPLDGEDASRARGKAARKAAYLERARREIAGWL
ncbi:MAG TPA: methylenetetrahydrofolate--tRNA-(uracil(54)-C(5))-methyltransferase (FADH(2)-oxidizing) TrmFO [Anaeromyxobacteraceae bacterium]|nr:methylenetetrahydrofolate--tRNA-(uracil(54)-C(5))-methyltransferase (FADH(2)-oxidizing) TrmFO [Anaeromyxobacteraceae bacterium]